MASRGDEAVDTSGGLVLVRAAELCRLIGDRRRDHIRVRTWCRRRLRTNHSVDGVRLHAPGTDRTDG